MLPKTQQPQQHHGGSRSRAGMPSPSILVITMLLGFSSGIFTGFLYQQHRQVSALHRSGGVHGAIYAWVEGGRASGRCGKNSARTTQLFSSVPPNDAAKKHQTTLLHAVRFSPPILLPTQPNTRSAADRARPRRHGARCGANEAQGNRNKGGRFLFLADDGAQVDPSGERSPRFRGCLVFCFCYEPHPTTTQHPRQTNNHRR